MKRMLKSLEKIREEDIPRLRYYSTNALESIVGFALGFNICIAGLIMQREGLNAYHNLISYVGGCLSSLSVCTFGYFHLRFRRLSKNLDEKFDTLKKGGCVDDQFIQ